MTDNLEKTKKVNCHRFILAIILFLISIVPVLLLRKRIFDLPLNETYHFYKFLWCFFSACTGLSAIAFYHRHEEESPWLKYITYYIPLIIAIASFVFGILHLWKETQGFVFYYLSGSLCFFFGFFVDYISSIWIELLKKFIDGSV